MLFQPSVVKATAFFWIADFKAVKVARYAAGMPYW